MSIQLLNITEKGKGSPLILLHGLFASGKNWLSTIPYFEKYYRVIYPDLRNHGQSFHSDKMDYETLADDVYRLCQSLKLPRVSVIGHSMGGKTAMVLALKYPDLIQNLIVVDIAPVTYSRNFKVVFDALFDLNIDSIESLEMAELQLMKKIPDTGLVRFLLTNLKRNEKKGYNWRINLKGIQGGMEYIRSFPVLNTPSYNKPVLFLKGETSHHISDRHTAERLNLFPNSQLITIKNSGHNIHTDNKSSFLSIASDFLGIR